MENQRLELTELVNQALDGTGSVFKAKFEFDKEIKRLQEIQKELNKLAAKEAEDYEASFQKDGFKIEKRKGRATYDYKGCKSWVEKNTELKDLEKDLKTAYDQYQKGRVMSDLEGELVEIPNVKYSDDIVVINPLE